MKSMKPSTKTTDTQMRPPSLDPFGRTPSNRDIEQAMIALKKGTWLLKYRRHGKPRSCHFRLSADELDIVYISQDKEKSIPLSGVTGVLPGQQTPVFSRYLRPEKEPQSFSVMYQNNERSLDVICKDPEEKELWCLGLWAIVNQGRKPKRERSVNLLDSSRSFDTPSFTETSPSSSPYHSFESGNAGSYSRPLQISAPFSANASAGASPRDLGHSHPASPSRDDSAPGPTTRPTSGPEVHSVFHQRSPPDLFNSPPSEMGPSDMSSLQGHAQSRLYHSGGPGMATSDTWSGPYIAGRSASSGALDASGRGSMSSQLSSSSQGSGRDDGETLYDVYIWGEGAGEGALGGGELRAGSGAPGVDASLPRALESGAVLDVRSIACGGRHAALVTRHGEVFSWGEDYGGRLGQGVDRDVEHPQLVEALTSLASAPIEQVSCGEYHSCAVSRSGELFTWGDGAHCYGLLGHGSASGHWLPKRVLAPLDLQVVVQVNCGPWHTAVVTATGQLFTFGEGMFGALGLGNRQSMSSPREVEFLRSMRVLQVSCGVWHTAAVVDVIPGDSRSALSPPGKLYTWGDGDKGRLGHGDSSCHLEPAMVQGIANHNVIQVACGHSITVALTSAGQVYTMGSSVHGQLGTSQGDGKTPVLVEGKLANRRVEQIACGAHHVAALLNSSDLYMWGKGANGRLGLGDQRDRDTPTHVDTFRDKRVVQVACGGSFTAAICQHKHASTTDHMACTQCKQPFTYVRLRHSCYNCGQLFCHGCSSKKALGAGMAPSSMRPYRVCDTCAAKLAKAAESAPTQASRKGGLSNWPKGKAATKNEKLRIQVTKSGPLMKGSMGPPSLRDSAESLGGGLPTGLPSSSIDFTRSQSLLSKPAARAAIPPTRNSAKVHPFPQRWGAVSPPATFSEAFQPPTGLTGMPSSLMAGFEDLSAATRAAAGRGSLPSPATGGAANSRPLSPITRAMSPSQARRNHSPSKRSNSPLRSSGNFLGGMTSQELEIMTLRRSNQEMGHEVNRLHTQVEQAKEQSEALAKEVAAVKARAERDIAQATSLANDESASLAVALDVVRLLTSQMKEMAKQLPDDAYRMARVGARYSNGTVLYSGPLVGNGELLPPALVEMPSLEAPAAASGPAARPRRGSEEVQRENFSAKAAEPREESPLATSEGQSVPANDGIGARMLVSPARMTIKPIDSKPVTLGRSLRKGSDGRESTSERSEERLAETTRDSWQAVQLAKGERDTSPSSYLPAATQEREGPWASQEWVKDSWQKDSWQRDGDRDLRRTVQLTTAATTTTGQTSTDSGGYASEGGRRNSSGPRALYHKLGSFLKKGEAYQVEGPSGPGRQPSLLRVQERDGTTNRRASLGDAVERAALAPGERSRGLQVSPEASSAQPSLTVRNSDPPVRQRQSMHVPPTGWDDGAAQEAIAGSLRASLGSSAGDPNNKSSRSLTGIGASGGSSSRFHTPQQSPERVPRGNTEPPPSTDDPSASAPSSSVPVNWPGLVSPGPLKQGGARKAFAGGDFGTVPPFMPPSGSATQGSQQGSPPSYLTTTDSNTSTSPLQLANREDPPQGAPGSDNAPGVWKGPPGATNGRPSGGEVTSGNEGSSRGRTSSRQSGASPRPRAGSRGKEWMEYPEAGVYITLGVSSHGWNELRRVRFSHKLFSEKQAESWWAENKSRVHHLYEIKSIQRSPRTSGPGVSSRSSRSSTAMSRSQSSSQASEQDRPAQEPPVEAADGEGSAEPVADAAEEVVKVDE